MLTVTEMENLRTRVRLLAQEKSYLQLVVRLMHRISSVQGLDDTIDTMMKAVIDVLGGAGVWLYYTLDDTIFACDVFGLKTTFDSIDSIDDERVGEVFRTGEGVDLEHDFNDTKMLTPEFTKAYTVVYPLVVGEEMIGVLKIESMHFDLRELSTELPLFFSYMALILKNEVSSRTRLKQAYDQLESANKELEAFAYSVSHDLRAPLRSVDGFGQALLEECSDELGESGRHYLTRIRAASQNMNQLIDELLQLSRVSRADLQRETVDLSTMASGILDDLARSAPERQVELVVAAALHAHCDAGLIRSVLLNLLGNAWKYTAKRDRAEIEFGMTRLAGKRAFFVRDNGAGFDMKHAGKLFSPFQRLHSAADFQGDGIGLATVQRIIRRHGGEVQGEGEVGHGATFIFTVG